MVIDKSATFRFVQITMFYVDILSVAPDRPGPGGRYRPARLLGFVLHIPTLHS